MQHRSSRTKLPLARGFTLIELMIVVVIISSVITLVGPNLFKAYEKAQYRTDLVELKDIVRQISYKAFINGRQVSLVLSGKTMHYQYADSPQKTKKNFEFIDFGEPQEVMFSEFGFTNVDRIFVKTSNDNTVIDLQELLSL